MTFCEGFKVTDSKALAAVDIDREAVMQSVTESFAYQVTGFASGAREDGCGSAGCNARSLEMFTRGL